MMNTRTPEELRTSLLRVERLYSTPQVLAKATRLLGEPEVSVDRIVELIQQDAALAADVLRVSNSAVFRRGEVNGSLKEAVGRLGYGEIRRVMALSLSKNVFGKGLANYGVSADHYWRESVLTGLLLAELARRAGADVDEAQLAGIMHSIGKVLINEVLEDIGWSLFWDGTVPVEDWERQYVGFTHAEAGALLLEKWGFPAAVVRAVAGQLDQENREGTDELGGLLRLAVAVIASERDFPRAAEGHEEPAAALAQGMGGAAGAWEIERAVRREFEAIRECLTA